ncbi:MAG: HPF/RaiA family ribosome-associated protein [Planctomycetaceae bacterium]|nr:HPF/RaiA family ribosome-associated protein [Planctomycetaceae bacterium]
MHIVLHTSRLTVSHSVKLHLERRLGFALGRFADVISAIDVRLEDINGPRGGIDKMCRLRVNLPGAATPVIVEVTDQDLRAAIDIAADRMGRAFSRRLDRRTGRRWGRRSTVELPEPLLHGDPLVHLKGGAG